MLLAQDMSRTKVPREMLIIDAQLCQHLSRTELYGVVVFQTLVALRSLVTSKYPKAPDPLACG